MVCLHCPLPSARFFSQFSGFGWFWVPGPLPTSPWIPTDRFCRLKCAKRSDFEPREARYPGDISGTVSVYHPPHGLCLHRCLIGFPYISNIFSGIQAPWASKNGFLIGAPGGLPMSRSQHYRSVGGRIFVFVAGIGTWKLKLES